VLFDTTQIALQRAISGASMRNEALASNLANANTPGYQRVDVDFHAALASALGSSTDGSSAQSTLDSLSFTPQADLSAGATRADGSTVDVEAESAKLSANALEQQAEVQIAHTRIGILQSAIGVPGH
jgi:flagellar basal-body rod protein FlgB